MNMKPNGNKILRLLFCAFSIFTLLFQCACFGGVGDWSYNLPNGYEIVRLNSQSVVFGKSEGVFEQTVDRYIISFCFNDSFIGLQRIPLDDVSDDEYIDIESYDRSNLEYYLIDTKTDAQYGPYTKSEYLAQCNKLDTNYMCEWIETLTKPEGAGCS